MTKKRRYLISAVVLVACVCIALGVVAMLPASSVTKANCDRIEKEMTHAQVKQILGEATVARALSPSIDWARYDDDKGKACIHVIFENGHVDRAYWNGFGLHDPPETIPDKLRRWLHFPR
jgi:hypothetical protein